MGQVSSKLRRATQGYEHWCPACEEMHMLFDSWNFVNKDLEKPTFTPSFKHTGIKTIKVNGVWTGEWERDANGKGIPYVCHYILTDGILHFCGDCTHSMLGPVPLPDLPEFMTDAYLEKP